MHDELLYAERVLRVGARGYVMKGEEPAKVVDRHPPRPRRTDLRERIRQPPYPRAAVCEAAGASPTENQGQIVDLLSNRELEVFQFIGQGRGTREIAGEMHVSVKTVETYRAHIKEKLHLKTAPELMRFALNWTHHRTPRSDAIRALRSPSDGKFCHPFCPSTSRKKRRDPAYLVPRYLFGCAAGHELPTLVARLRPDVHHDNPPRRSRSGDARSRQRCFPRPPAGAAPSA